LLRSKIIDYKSKIKTVVFLGVLTKDKGIEDALKVFSILENLGNYNYWIIGKGSEKYKNYLLVLANRLGIKNKVTFWGFVDDSKKFELLAKAHILINPSIREGWGLVNIEANSVGVPVVAYKSPGLVDSVKNGESGVIVDNNNPHELAKSISFILDNQKNYEDLQKKSILWSKRFSWDRSKTASLKLIEKIV
ncbi:MAG: glycosyltransferase, partial [Candidatus Woesebacteria bacterium]|nr:glycosyltransferase [Candidatus Woesebacteria bacterium]